MGTTIEKKLNEAGYRMLGDNNQIEILIIDILKNENVRYLKAIPFLLYKYKLDVHNIYKKIKNKELFNVILNITGRILQSKNIESILPFYTGLDKKKEKKYNQMFDINYEEFRDEFELQLQNEKKTPLFLDKQNIIAERELQFHLSQIFTEKEKEIIKRILEDKPISKTDYEYFSRKTKKKLYSIINLYDFAKTLFTLSPNYDNTLFRLKKKLEEWLGKESNKAGIIILSFFLWNNGNIISIDYKMKQKELDSKIYSMDINTKKIKDKEMIQLLKKYERYDFR